jgi:hypothetical protein
MNGNRCPAAALFLAGVLTVGALSGCGASDADPDAPPPVTLSDVGHDGLKQVTLTDAAAARLAVRTATATAPTAPAAGVTVAIPYAAVVYAANGSTWAYVPGDSRNSYVRQKIVISSVSGDVANLSTGPRAGTAVVVLGAPELLGAEAEISGEE